MPDLSALSDADLLAQLQRDPASPAGDVSALSDADLLAALAASSTWDKVRDAARGVGAGVLRGAASTAAFLSDAPDLIQQAAVGGGSWLAEKAGLMKPEDAAALRAAISSEPTRGQAAGSALVDAAGGYTPRTDYGRFGQSVGEFLPQSLVTGGGSVAGNAVKYGVLPGVASEAAAGAAGAEGTPWEPAVRALGAMLGGLPGSGIDAVRAVRGSTDGILRDALGIVTLPQLEQARTLMGVTTTAPSHELHHPRHWSRSCPAKSVTRPGLRPPACPPSARSLRWPASPPFCSASACAPIR